MDFTIEFYETSAGKCPAIELLNAMKREDPGDYAAMLAGLDKLKKREYHKPPLSKPIGDGLFELRHVGKLNTRLFYLFAVGKRIVVVHGIRHKAQAIRRSDIEVARTRMTDWLERNRR